MAFPDVFRYLMPMQLFLVGGYPRDTLLGRPAGDKDFVFDGTPEAFLARFPEARQAGRFHNVYLVGNVEFSQMEGGSIHEDLQRRDLSINALALPVDDPSESPDKESVRKGLIAHPSALADLDAKILRPASDASFIKDPLRVFRAARFAAALPEFSASAELLSLMGRVAEEGRLDGIIAERVGVEMRKAVAASRPGRFTELLAEANCLSPWFKELEGAQDIEAGPFPYHDEDVLTHTGEVMDRVAGLLQSEGTASPLTVWMALTHDLGKMLTPADKHPSHHNHDRLGIKAAEALGRRLMLPERWIKAGIAATEEHLIAGRYAQLRPGTRVDLLDRLYRMNLVDEMFTLVRADGGDDFRAQARDHAQRMLSVKLKEEDRNKGAWSGQKLRQLRCEELKKG